MNINLRNLVVWLILGVLILVLFNIFQSSSSQNEINEVPFSILMKSGSSGQIKDITVSGQKITGHYQSGQSFRSFAPQSSAYVDELAKNGVTITVRPQSDQMPSLLGILINWFPIILLVAVWFYLMRQMQGGGGKAMGFGRSKAKLLTEAHGRVVFNDVAGVDEAKHDLEEIVEFLRDPKKFQRLGGKIPRGVLLVGPPGTGKTLLARAVAGEAQVPFFTISGSDFVEMFVGVGASRVRDMFEQAKKNSPCIIFIDEIDAVGRHRGAGLGGGNDEREQTLNQLLVEMDGFEPNESIILIAATNRPDVLDPALLRPGRFDRQVVVPLPDVIGREKILKVHGRNVPLAPDVDLRVVARGTPGFSGADLMNLVNESALLAARRGKKLVTMAEFEDAKDKVMMGAERRTLVMSEEEKKLTAYHEAGHALVALKLPASDPIHKATIIPRGRALGMVVRLPERDRISMTREKCYADLAVAMGGRIAEELIFGHDKVTSGAASDIQMATQLARDMVTRFGMSDKLGPLAYGENEEEVFLGHSVAKTKNLSDETQRAVDEEVKNFVGQGFAMAEDIIKSNTDQLEMITKNLLEYETLTGDEIKAIIDGKPVVRQEDSGDGGKAGKPSTVPVAGNSEGGAPPEINPQPQA